VKSESVKTVVISRGFAPSPRSFVLDPVYKGRLPQIKEQVIDMALNGSGIRDTARVLKISPTTGINERKKESMLSGTISPSSRAWPSPSLLCLG
jgi:insertion element IS1 protein InsB